MYTRHTHNRRNRNRLLRGRAPRRGGGGQLTLRQQIGAVLGVEPQVYADARDLTVGDGNAVATWGDFAATGTPTLDADGFGGLPEVECSEGNAFNNELLGEDYNGHPAHVWVATINNAASPQGLRQILTANANVNRNTNWIRFYLNEIVPGTVSVFYRSSDDDGNEVDTSNLVVSYGPMHIGVSFDGSSVNLVQLAGGQMHVLSQDAPHDRRNPLNMQIVSVGRHEGTTPSNYFNGGVALVSMTACSAGAATLANLQAVLNLHNQAYPVA